MTLRISQKFSKFLQIVVKVVKGLSCESVAERKNYERGHVDCGKRHCHLIVLIIIANIFMDSNLPLSNALSHGHL